MSPVGPATGAETDRRLDGGRTLAGILLMAGVLRVVGINGGFPDINRYFFESDESTVVQAAMAFGTGDLNPHTFEQPTFLPYLLFGLYGLLYLGGLALARFSNPDDFAYLYFVTPGPFYLLGRGVSLVAGLLTVWLTYRLGSRLFGRTAGLLAAFFLAVSGLHVHASQIMKTDATSVFFVVAALLCCVDVVETGRWRASWLAGLCTGLAAGTRYPSGMVCLCVIAAHFLNAGRSGRPWWRWPLNPGLWGAGAAAALAFLAVAPFTVLDWRTFSQQIGFLSQYVSTAGDPFTLGYRPNLWLLHWTQLAEPQVLGPVLVSLMLLGCGISAWRHRWEDVLLWPMPLVLYWLYSDSHTFTRTVVPSLYLLPAIPVLFVLAGRAIAELADSAARWPRVAGIRQVFASLC